MDNKQVIDFLIAFGYNKEQAREMLASPKGIYFKGIYSICRDKVREIQNGIENKKSR